MRSLLSSRSAVRAGTARAALMGLLALVAGCGDGGSRSEADAARPPVTVMVIDHGFDPSHPTVTQKITAAYTIECRGPDAGADAGASSDGDGGAAGDGGADGGTAADARPFAEARSALLVELGRPDETCRLRPGIEARPNPFADLEGKRLAWNQAIRAGQLVGNPFAPSPFDALFAQLLDRLKNHPVHGTATAGMIAQENPAVRLVLVERVLGDLGTVQQQFTCILQDEVDEAVALFSDPEVRAAYLARPSSTLDRDLAAALFLHQVGIVNESFGRVSRLALERLQQEKRCKPVALRPYFALMVELDRLREEAHPRPALVTKAAGNDGALINGPEDSLDCRLGSTGLVLVGSYGRNSVRSSFSNFGGCLDAYAPGEQVIAPLPGDWVMSVAGTSFSAPLAVRLATLTAPAPFAPDTARAALLALRQPNRNLPLALFPPTLVPYARPRPVGQALTAVEPLATPAPWLPSAPVLHQALWPIRWLQRHRSR